MIGWLIVGVTLAAGYGWSARLLRQSAALAALHVPYYSGWLTVLLGLALSVGALTLIMLAEALLSIPLTLAGIAVPYFALMLPGWWRVPIRLPRLPSGWMRRFALLVLLVLSAAILFNGAYLPFHRDDTLGIYQPAAQAIYRTGALVPVLQNGNPYNGYPVLIPLSYAYAYFASGWENEYLAKTIATLLSLACIPAAYVLGKHMRGEITGWLAALIVALTPFYSRWASSGYVDLPMAFFYTLGAIFALRLADGGARHRDAMLTGILVGLAAWTKNAALLGIPLLVLWLAWSLYRASLRPRDVAICLIACALVAAPWYSRNLLDAGYLMPPTAWTDQAQRTFDSALVYLTHPQDFGASGWLIVGGVFALGVFIARRPWMFIWQGEQSSLLKTTGATQQPQAAERAAPGQILILLWTLPFFAAWWLFVSYDPRFLLLFLPLLCVLAGDWLARLWDDYGARIPSRALAVLALLVLLLLAPILWQAVEYKGELLRNPLMSDADKRALVGRSPAP